jgi:hypothetical protein
MTTNSRQLDSKVNCGMCGKPLVYGTETRELQCSICGKKFQAQIYCPEGHYICDDCHSRSALETVKSILKEHQSSDPAQILEDILDNPAVPMHGPEHHAIVPAVLVKAAENAGYKLPEGALEKALERGSKVPGGWCGLYGDCGAGVGVGVATSVITEATPLKGPQRGLAIGATAATLSAMLDDRPRCCKRASRTAVRAAVKYFREKLKIDLPEPGRVKCSHVKRNPQCAGPDCPYFG